MFRYLVVAITAGLEIDNSAWSQEVDGDRDRPDTPGAAHGYRGRDEFAVLEGLLERPFPIHDEAGAPTGRIRQLQYTLNAGEAGWILKADKVLEF